jgi:hypothetical protein
MTWVPYLVIVIGLLLLGLIPVLVVILRINPMLVVRPIWHDSITSESARLVGILIIVITFVGGLLAIMSGVKMLNML